MSGRAGGDGLDALRVRAARVGCEEARSGGAGRAEIVRRKEGVDAQGFGLLAEEAMRVEAGVGGED